MKRTVQLGLALAVVIAANAIAGPPNLVAIQRHPAIYPVFRERIEARKPGLVLIGNSILREGIDERALSARTDRHCLEVAKGGAASAWWYLALKNQVAAASHPVPLVVIVFRDHFLTEPSYRVTGSYKKAIDQIAGAREPVLDRLAYLDGMDSLAYGLSRFVPLYRHRDRARTLLERSVKEEFVGRALGLDPGEADAAIERVFAREAMDPERFGARQAESEAPSSHAVYDFAERVPRSFLPEMLRLAEAAEIQLVFVRAKRRRDLDPPAEPTELADYVEALEAYLAERGTPLLDFSDDERLRAEHFAHGDHLNVAGRALFTELLAEALEPHLDTHRGT